MISNKIIIYFTLSAIFLGGTITMTAHAASSQEPLMFFCANNPISKKYNVDGVTAGELMGGCKEKLDGYSWGSRIYILIYAPGWNTDSNALDVIGNNSHAPINIGWGFDNRTVAVRVPNASLSAKRLELRVPGADSNPYLLFGILVSAILDGIDEMVKAPKPVSGNGYEANLKSLPRDLKTAIIQFEKSEKIRHYMPTILREMFLSTKKQEMRKVISGDFDE